MPESQAQPSEPVAFLEEILPLLLSDGGVMFPSMVVPIVVAEERDVRVIEEAAQSPSKLIAVVAQKPTAEGRYDGEPYSVGAVATVLRMAKTPIGQIHAIVQGVARIRIQQIEESDPLRAHIERLEEIAEASTELEALARTALSLFQKAVSLGDTLPQEVGATAAGIAQPSPLADFIAANLPIKTEERQAILETLDVKERLRLVIGYLQREVEVLEVKGKIQSQVRGEMEKHQREFILREQLRAIRKELGEEVSPELSDLKKRLEEAHLPPEAQKEADRELERLTTIPAQSPEYQVARTYLEWLADLPWNKSSEDQLDIDRAEQILNEDHYGLEKVKQRILDFLAVRKLQPEAKGPILCFVGPPGTGKTSLGQSIARALGRKFIRMSLGGVRDEAEIRGHRRTYVGALPGRILQEVRRAGTNNPLFMLDEVDKLGIDFRGDPSAALLEVLDPQQNNTFVDHYLDVPFDLSRVMFITTANLRDPIPPPLQDRMETIELPGYTEKEKLEIARRYLLPRQVRENGVDSELVTIPDETILEIIRSYTREAGVRNVERELGGLCRYVARRLARGDREAITIVPDMLAEILGPAPFHWTLAEEKDEIGVATGLAWTPVGGDVLFVEAVVFPGRGHLTLTGKLGDVMQESAQAAFTYARTRVSGFNITSEFFETHDFHIHVPAGAIPKDGPSAGVTMATVLVSAITGRPVRKDVAMTGEITLRGKVLPVGGIRDKILAAHRAGIKTIVLPKENGRDLAEVPAEVKEQLKLVLAEHVDEVLDTALHPRPADEERPLPVAPMAAAPQSKA
ncbi:MAG TPA: endopeptidase La [Dehalococcoidia bacterium]|nr:endopeptidase La [Dehalococcoidia bacterium]